jgi:hypothetical protein
MWGVMVNQTPLQARVVDTNLRNEVCGLHEFCNSKAPPLFHTGDRTYCRRGKWVLNVACMRAAWPRATAKKGSLKSKRVDYSGCELQQMAVVAVDAPGQCVRAVT